MEIIKIKKVVCYNKLEISFQRLEMKIFQKLLMLGIRTNKVIRKTINKVLLNNNLISCMNKIGVWMRGERELILNL